jgi:hypothetical protein
MDEKERFTLFIRGKDLEGDDRDLFETTVPPLRLGESTNTFGQYVRQSGLNVELLESKCMSLLLKKQLNSLFEVIIPAQISYKITKWFT